MRTEAWNRARPRGPGPGVWAFGLAILLSGVGELSSLTQEFELYYADNMKPLSSFENDLLRAMPQEILLVTAGTIGRRRGGEGGSSEQEPVAAEGPDKKRRQKRNSEMSSPGSG